MKKIVEIALFALKQIGSEIWKYVINNKLRLTANIIIIVMVAVVMIRNRVFENEITDLKQKLVEANWEISDTKHVEVNSSAEEVVVEKKTEPTTKKGEENDVELKKELENMKQKLVKMEGKIAYLESAVETEVYN